MLKSELVEKAKKAKSKEELIALAKENSIPLADGEAEYYMALLKDSSIHGEVGDDELNDVSGGCKGSNEIYKSYTIVSSGKKCFTGQWEDGYKHPRPGNENLKSIWSMWSSDGCCGTCSHLSFDGLVGYCGCTAEFNHKH